MVNIRVQNAVKLKVKSLSRVQLFAIPWSLAYQALLSMRFSMQEYWRGLPFPSPRYLPNPGIKPRSLTLQVDSLLSKPTGKPRKPPKAQLLFPKNS